MSTLHKITEFKSSRKKVLYMIYSIIKEPRGQEILLYFMLFHLVFNMACTNARYSWNRITPVKILNCYDLQKRKIGLEPNYTPEKFLCNDGYNIIGTKLQF